MGSENKPAFIEIARILIIFLVVLLHSTNLATSKYGNTATTNFISTATLFAVPLFFMVSAFLLAIQDRDPNYSVDIKKFWQSRLHTLVLPFLVWNVIYMLVEKNLFDSPIVSFSTLFNLATGYDQLFLIFVLLQCFVVYSLIANKFSEKLVRNCLILFALTSIAFYGLSSYLLWTHVLHGSLWYGKLIIPWGIFFFWGIWLGYNRTGLERVSQYRFYSLFAAIIALIPYLLSHSFQLYAFGGIYVAYFVISALPFQFLAASALLGFLYHWEPSIQSNKRAMAVASWGKYVFAVFVSYLAFLYYFNQGWTLVFPNAGAISQITAETLFTFFITFVFVFVCSKPRLSPLNRVLFGGRGK